MGQIGRLRQAADAELQNSSTHGSSTGAPAMCAAIEPIGRYRQGNPAQVIKEAAAKHDPAWNRPDLGTFNEFVEVRCHFRMDRQLSKIRGRLNHDDPDVGSPNPATCGAKEAYVVARMKVVVRQDRSPGGIVRCTIADQDRCVQMRFHIASSRAPDVEIAVTTRLQSEKHREQHADQDQRQTLGFS